MMMFGLDVERDIKQIRQMIGYCPQQDILYDELTAEEHLKFFCELKGYVYNVYQAHIINIFEG